MSSPMPGAATTITVWAVRMTSTSAWPVPTVSIMIGLYPAASMARTTSRVEAARPPRLPRLAILRIKTLGSPDSSIMRMRSPRIAPPVSGLVGSTATTPTLASRRRHSRTRCVTRVLLPAPGAPVMPTIWARPAYWCSSARKRRAAGISFSISVTMRASARRSPLSRRSTMFSKVHLHLGGQAIRLHIVTHEIDDLLRRCPGTEATLDAHRLDGRYILIRQDASGGHQDIVHAFLLEQLHYFGEKGHMRARENTHQYSIHVFLDGRLNDHLRCLTNTCINYFHAGITQGTGNHFCTSIMSIQARLGDQYANWASFSH